MEKPILKKRKIITGWSEAPKELLELIFWGLGPADMIRFSCVCSYWRSLSMPPWLVLPCNIDYNINDGKNKGFVGLVNLFDSNHKIHKLLLPVSPTRGRICGSSAGWFITLHYDGKIHLLHPFSGTQIGLPSVPFLNWRQVMKTIVVVGLASNGESQSSNSSSVFDVVVIAEPTFLVFFCNGMYRRWKFTSDYPGKYQDIVFYKGKFYTLYTRKTKQYICVGYDMNSYYPRMLRIMEIPNYQKHTKPYLVESSGELLMVLRHLDWNFGSNQPSKTIGFTINKVDLAEKKLVELKNIGRDHALFLDRYNAQSVFTPRSPGCKGNCIYFVADCFSPYCNRSFGWYDMGVFNLEDGTIEELNYCRDKKLIMHPPIWFVADQCWRGGLR